MTYLFCHASGSFVVQTLSIQLESNMFNDADLSLANAEARCAAPENIFLYAFGSRDQIKREYRVTTSINMKNVVKICV